MPTLFVVAVDADAVGDGAVERAGLVVVLGRQALLQPVVEVDAPGGVALAQLVEAAQGTQGHPCRKSLALLVKAHLPILLACIYHAVT